MSETAKSEINQMFKVGAHLGYARTRRHPSIKTYIFGSKNETEIFDLAKTQDFLEEAKSFVFELGKTGKQLLFVGTKPEIREIVRQAASVLEAPYVVERWIGGTLTNATEIRKRVDRLIDLKTRESKGELAVYTKREQGKFSKEQKDLARFFDGLVSMKDLPKGLFLIDSREEETALREAQRVGVPVVALCNSDCDISKIDYPIVCNDASRSSVSYFVSKIVEAYQAGRGGKPSEPIPT